MRSLLRLAIGSTELLRSGFDKFPHLLTAKTTTPDAVTHFFLKTERGISHASPFIPVSPGRSDLSLGLQLTESHVCVTEVRFSSERRLDGNNRTFFLSVSFTTERCPYDTFRTLPTVHDATCTTNVARLRVYLLLYFIEWGFFFFSCAMNA